MDQAYLLCKAARYGQGADVRTLLSAGAHVDGRDAVVRQTGLPVLACLPCLATTAASRMCFNSQKALHLLDIVMTVCTNACLNRKPRCI